MKKQISISMLLLGLSVTVLVHAADETDKAVEDIATDPKVENEEELLDADDPLRIKRQQHNAGPFSGILSSVFNKKLGLIGSLSSVSGSSSSKNVETHHHTYEYAAPAPAPKPFDWYGFKKTILASLLQAVKAITGGVIALNGQLVKVKGHLLAAKAHLLSTKGDSITAFGRHIVTHAFSTPHDTAHTDTHEPVPSAPASAPSGYGASGAALEHGYQTPFKSAGFEYPNGFYKDPTIGYAKRAAPLYYLLPQDSTPTKSNGQ